MEGSSVGKEVNCVLNTIVNIHEIQEAVEDQWRTSFYRNLLSPSNFAGDTIPFILYTTEGEPFYAYGNVGGLKGGDCFKTAFFRIENIHNSCVTLSLLEPNGFKIWDTNNLVKTHFCIEVDLSCFCAIQCLNSRLVVNSF